VCSQAFDRSKRNCARSWNARGQYSDSVLFAISHDRFLGGLAKDDCWQVSSVAIVHRTDNRHCDRAAVSYSGWRIDPRSTYLRYIFFDDVSKNIFNRLSAAEPATAPDIFFAATCRTDSRCNVASGYRRFPDRFSWRDRLCSIAHCNMGRHPTMEIAAEHSTLCRHRV